MLNTSEETATNTSSQLLNVMLVDDSAIVRGLLRRIIQQDDKLNIIGTASDGKIAVDKYKNLKPDVVLMDIEMPEMDGIEALTEILQIDPQAKVIMCSSLTQKGASMTVKALRIGAVDCLAKPTSNSIDRSQDFEDQLLLRLKAFAKKKRGTETVSSNPASSSPVATSKRQEGGLSIREFPNSLAVSKPQVIAIGSSTGGPKALSTVLSQLNKSIDIPPIVITQHIPEGFTKVLAETIEKDSGLTTLEGADDILLKPKHIYISPGGKHMMVERRTSGIFLKLSDEDPVNFCKPSVDMMMDSVLEVYQTNILSIILTGMGQDGQHSCTRIVDANQKNLLIAQDEETSTVWGMPGAVAKAGACHAILPLEEIAEAINKLLTGQRP